MEIKDKILKTERVDWRIIKDLQPENFKEKDNHTFLKDSLKKYGFSKAFDVWQDQITEQIYFCDGHSRAYILKELEQEGYEIPTFLTCNFLNVNTEKEAIQVLIEVHSQKQNAINLEVLEVWCEAENIEVNINSINVVLLDIIEDEPEQDDKVPEKLDLSLKVECVSLSEREALKKELLSRGYVIK